MRIGLFTDTYEPDINGVSTSVSTLKNVLEKLGHDIFVVTNHNRLTIEKRGNIIFLPGIELKKLYGYTMSFLYSFKGKKEVKNLNLDIIHVHTEFGVGIFGRIVAKELNIPIVATYHTAYEDYTHYVNKTGSPKIEAYTKTAVRNISKLYVNTVDAVIAPSEKTEKMLRSYNVKKPIYVIPTGLSLERFHVQNDVMIKQIKMEYDINEYENIAIFIGRIAQEKNIKFLLEAFQYVENGRLMIVGDGPQLLELKEYAKTLHVEDKIIFTGKKPNAQIAQYYKCADCFISASTSETQGMTYIEAMASGLVVFAQKDEVVEELIIEGENGYFFASPRELANKLEKYFILDDKQKQKLKEEACMSVKKYDEVIFGEDVLEVYRDVIAKKVIIIDVRFEKDKIHLWTTETEIDVDLDTYIEFHLRKGLELDIKTWEKLLETNKRYVIYNNAARKINQGMKTEQEMRKFLVDDVTSEEIIDFVISKLKSHNLINDDEYAESYVNSFAVKKYSNAKIMRKLEEKGITSYDLSDRDERMIALEYAQKLQKTNINKANHEQKDYIRKKLYAEKFNIDSIQYALSHLEFIYDAEKENEALMRVYNKAERLYKHYEGFEKERRIKLYLRQKGFSYHDITFEEEE